MKYFSTNFLAFTIGKVMTDTIDLSSEEKFNGNASLESKLLVFQNFSEIDNIFDNQSYETDSWLYGHLKVIATCYTIGIPGYIGNIVRFLLNGSDLNSTIDLRDTIGITSMEYGLSLFHDLALYKFQHSESEISFYDNIINFNKNLKPVKRRLNQFLAEVPSINDQFIMYMRYGDVRRLDEYFNSFTNLSDVTLKEKILSYREEFINAKIYAEI